MTPKRAAHLRKLALAWKGRRHSEVTKLKISVANKGRTGGWNLGLHMSPEAKLKMSLAKKGKAATIAAILAMSKAWTIERRKELGLKNSRKVGSSNPNWRGGITKRTRGIRFSAPYKKWRKTVLDRDGEQCCWCGSVEHGLHVDHIKPIKQYPELMFVPENGRVLCFKCHIKTPTYGGRKT